jgi:hypothetical protein
LWFCDLRLAAKAHAFQRAEWQEQSFAVAKTNHLAQNLAVAPRYDVTTRAHGQVPFDARDFHKQALHARNAPENQVRRDGFDGVNETIGFGGHD